MQRFTVSVAISVEQGQLHGTASGVAAAAALISGYLGCLHALGQRHGLCEIPAWLQLCLEITAPQQINVASDRFAGDILTRNPFTEPLAAVLEDAANQEIVRLGARVRSVANGTLKRDANMERGQLDNFQENLQHESELVKKWGQAPAKKRNALGFLRKRPEPVPHFFTSCQD